jgi:glycosyltransferase involved in cell wall biosynthesis
VRLVIFSPTAVPSAIGRVTGLLVAALIDQGHEVVVVRSEDVSHLDSPSRALPTRIIRWDDADAVSAVAEASDAVIYQIGDFYSYHRGCLEWLPTLPGIVCLHDYFLGDLFNGWAVQHRPEAETILRAWYGEAVASRYFSHSHATSFIAATADASPMTEWVASMAQGVVTHSSWGIARVLAACPGPVRVVPLPYDSPGLAVGPRRTTTAGNADFRVLTVGHANANKRMESVIRAIGASPRLLETTVYRLVGRIEPAVDVQLSALADGLGARLSISGEVGDTALWEALDQADVVCCLRLPALEAASASTIEAMLYGKAVIVVDTGFYKDLPDDCVRKVSPEREVDDLRRELESLQADPSARAALGERAAEWARATFRADGYAESLTRICADVAAAAPALEASRFFAETLVRWGASEEWVTTEDIVAPLRILEHSSGQRTARSRGLEPAVRTRSRRGRTTV